MYQVRLSHTKQECTTLSFIYDMGCTSSDRALDLMLHLFISSLSKWLSRRCVSRGIYPKAVVKAIT